MKIVKGIVKVVAVVATVLSLIPGPWQPVAAIVAAIASIASATLEIISPTKPKGATAKARGSPTQYQLDPNAGIPYMMGRTQNAGNCVKRETWGTDNQYQGFTTVYSLGPINAVEAFQADKTTITFSAGGAALGSLAGFMWFVSQLGLCPSPLMASPVAGYPAWTANSKLSGLAASNWVIKFDTNAKKYTGGPPQPGIIAQGVKVYDPRLDSTFPGGSGACRAGNEATYVYSETPHLHALTYALGRYQNGKRRFGIGFPASSIDVSYFANAANIDEANGWKVGGVISSTDNKWETLKLIMEAGGGAPVTAGGRLSGLQRAPKSSVATITGDEIVGASSVVATQSIRDRINTGVPRFRSEDHGWEYVTGDPCRVATYVALDGGERTREFPWTLVQQKKQAAQLTFYEIYDAREMGPIELRLKIRWVGLRAGDCVVLNIPDMNLINQKCIVLTRTFDVETGSVSLKLRTETDVKHTDALAALGTAPPIQSLAFDPDYTPPAPTGWTLSSGGLSTSGGTVPTLRFSGAVGATNAQSVEFLYKKTTDSIWSVAGRGTPDTVRFDVSSVAPGIAYNGRVRYIVNGKNSDPLDLGPFTVESLTASGATVADSIVGQGSLATENYVYFASPYIKESLGGPDASLVNFKTILGPSSGFTGQGALATKDSVDLATSEVINKSLASVDLTASNKLGSIAAGAGTVLTSVVLGGEAGRMTRTGNTFTQVGALALAWRSFAYSTNGFSGTSFVAGRTLINGGQEIIGLSSSSNLTNADVAPYEQRIDYAWDMNGLNARYREGATVVQLATNITSSDVLGIVYDGVNIKYLINGGVFRTVAVGPGLTFLPKMITNGNGSGFQDVQYGAFSQNNWSAVGGTGKPTDYADVTSSNISAGFTGQSLWATYSSILPITMANRTQYLGDTSGRVTDYRGYASNRSYGIKSTYSGPSFSDTWIGTNNVTINVGASTLTTDTGATLNLPSGSVTSCASNTKYYLFRTMTDPSSATGSYGASTTLEGAMGPDKVYLGFWTTRATSGGSGGGGGGGNLDCVHAMAFVLTKRGSMRARHVAAGDWIWGLKPDGSGCGWLKVTGNKLADAPGYRWVSFSGIVNEFSETTPMTLRSGNCVFPGSYSGELQAVQDGAGFRWEPGTIRPVGLIPVSHISAGGGTYAAGIERGFYHFAHNLPYKP